MSTHIIYASPPYFASLCEAIGIVAAEKIYLETVGPIDFKRLATFQHKLIDQDLPAFYALENQQVVGWCDIRPPHMDNPRTSHRGTLAMGVRPTHRNQGIGGQLLKAALAHARTHPQLEKVELSVYTTNAQAIALYKKFGFNEEGRIKHYRKLDGHYFDTLQMALFVG